MNQTNGTVFYLERQPLYQTVKPYFCYIPPQALNGNPITNQKYEEISIDLKDARGNESLFALDRNGFEFAEHHLSDAYDFDRFQQDEGLILQYGREMETFLKEKLGARKVLLFDHELRRRNPEFPKESGSRSSLEQPVRGVHVDSSPASALERAVYHCRGEANRELLSGRIQIINAWRPLFTPLQDWPLAVCDGRSVDVESDFIPSDSVFPHNVAETLQVFHNKAHEWWFLGDQRRDEVLLFKIFDTNETVTRFCPHASFDWTAHTPSRPRESIEIRTMVFYGPSEQA